MVDQEELGAFDNAIDNSPFHAGLVQAETASMQRRYKQAITMRLVPRAIELVTSIGVGIVSGHYRDAIKLARKLVDMMERISED